MFLVSLLKPYASSSILDYVVLPPPLVVLVYGLEYELETSLDSKVIYATNYSTWLLDYTLSHQTWDHAKNLANAR